MAIAPANAHFLGFWFMLILTGVYLNFLPRLVNILRQKWKDGVLHLWLPIASVLFFVVFFLHLGIEMHRVWEAFSVHGTIPGNPEAFYRNAASPESLVKNGLTPAIAIVSDAILVYRTFVIWTSHRWVIVLPTALLLAGFATGTWATWTLSQTKSGDVLIFAAVTHRVRIFFVITFVLNLLCSGLISFKLWRISAHDMGGRHVQGLSTGKVLGVIIESAAIYCAHLFALIVTSIAGSNAFFAFLNPLPQTTALVFSLLILRIASKARRDTAGSSTSQYPTIAFSQTRNQQSTVGVEIDLERTCGDSTASVRSPDYGIQPMTDVGDDKDEQPAL